ncbi:MAG: MotA/TolQ/ExbB proton channel family protein [Myxococcaceae bacterium]
MGNVAQFFVEGGIWMVPIAFCSMLVLAVAVERCYSLLITHSRNAANMMSTIKPLLLSHQADKALKVCSEKPGAALSVLCRYALEQAAGSEEEIRQGIDEGMMEAVPKVQKRIHTLSGLASLATLLGLLGTVMGLIEAFTVVADAPPDQKSILLTRAISVAMNCTAFGLMVAIPAMFFQLFLSGIAKKLNDDLEAVSMKLENLLIATRLKK